MKKMGIFILLMLGVLLISHYKNVKPAAKASPALDESTQETTTVGEPRQEEPEEITETAEPKEEKETKKEKKEEVTADEEAEETEEVTDNTKKGKVFNRDEIGAILVCILFCVAFLCGYCAAHIIFKKL